MAVGSGWRLAVGRRWRLTVGGGWRLAVGGGWWLAVDGPLGRSLRAILNQKKKVLYGPPWHDKSPTRVFGAETRHMAT